MANLIINLVEKNATGLFNVGTDVQSMYELGLRTNQNVKPTHMIIDNTILKNITTDYSKMKKVLGH